MRNEYSVSGKWTDEEVKFGLMKNIIVILTRNIIPNICCAVPENATGEPAHEVYKDCDENHLCYCRAIENLVERL